MSKLPDIKSMMQKAMMAHVIFSSISFVPRKWTIEQQFVVRDSNLAEAFIAFREAYPEEDISELEIYCKL